MTLIREEGTEYVSMTNWARSAETMGQVCWTLAMIAAVTILAWGKQSQSCALMIPAIVAVAVGFYASLRARQQVYSIAGYLEGTQPSWISGLDRLGSAQDWTVTCIANCVVVLAIVFSWLMADNAWRGELMSGMVTGCGIVFAFHSISETSRLPQVGAAPQLRASSRGEQRRERAVGE